MDKYEPKIEDNTVVLDEIHVDDCISYAKRNRMNIIMKNTHGENSTEIYVLIKKSGFDCKFIEKNSDDKSQTQIICVFENKEFN